MVKKRLTVLILVALVAAACTGGTEEPAPVQVGMADSDAGEPGSGVDDGASTGQGSTGQESADSQATEPAADKATADSGLDAKTRTAVAVSDLPRIDGPPGGADEAEAVFDEVNEGEIEQALGIDRWTFDAQEGQLLAINMVSIDNNCNQDLDLVLVSPYGHRGNAGWVGNGGCHIHGPFELDQSGGYAIEFVGGDGSVIDARTGAYRFVPIFLTEHDVAPLVFDEVNEGEISQLLGVDRWTFEAEAGSQLTIDVLTIDNDCRQDLTLVLEDPFEERHDVDWIGNNGCHVHGPIELERAGAYALEFVGGAGSVIEDSVGGYRFVPSFLTERDEEALVTDQRLEGEISQLFGADRWTFDASEGDILVIEVFSIGDGCKQDVELILEDPFGQREQLSWVGNGGCEAHGPYELELDGTYVIEFVGGGGGVIEKKTGPYTFSATIS